MTISQAISAAGLHAAPTWKTAAAVGTAAAVASFAPSVLPRSERDQYVVAAASALTAAAAAGAIDRTITAAANRWNTAPGGGQVALRVAAAVTAIGASIALERSDADTTVAGGLARTAAIGIGATAVAGLGAIGVRRAAAAAAARLPGGAQAWNTLLIGAAGIGAGAAALGIWNRATSGTDERGVRDLLIAGAGTAVAGAALVAGYRGARGATRLVDRVLPLGGIAAAAALGSGIYLGGKAVISSRIDASQRIAPDEDGPIAPGSSIMRSTIDEPGRRFIDGATGGLAAMPIRVYVGVQTAGTVEARVTAAVDELERQGAFYRERIIVVSPTGSGYANELLLEAVERMADGDVASVSVQYNRLPSALSLTEVDEGAEAHALLLKEIEARRQQLHGESGGPRVYVYGESLGAWSSREALPTVQRMDDLGVDGAYWTGVPGMSRITGDERIVEAPTAAAGASLLDGQSRALAVSHIDDPVAKFAWRNFIARPEWVDAANENATDPLHGMGWLPVISGLHGIGDLAGSMGGEQAGKWGVSPHDYRADVAAGARAAFGFTGISDAALNDINEQLLASELRRAGGEG